MALSPIQARMHTHTRKSTHIRTVPKYGCMEGGKQILAHGQNHWKNHFRHNKAAVFFVFGGGLGHRGGVRAVFDSAFAEGQKLRAHLRGLRAVINCMCVKGNKLDGKLCSQQRFSVCVAEHSRFSFIILRPITFRLPSGMSVCLYCVAVLFAWETCNLPEIKQ